MNSKIFNFFWESVGFIIITVLIGSVYGLIASPIILFFFPHIKVIHVIASCCIVLMATGLFSFKFLIDSTIGIIYSIGGFITGLTILGGGIPHDPDILRGIGGVKLKTVLLFLIGLISGIFAVIRLFFL